MSTIYDILRRPLVTEKSNYQLGKLHQYVFQKGNRNPVAGRSNPVL
jgi:ribosomal protein L23